MAESLSSKINEDIDDHVIDVIEPQRTVIIDIDGGQNENLIDLFDNGSTEKNLGLVLINEETSLNKNGV